MRLSTTLITLFLFSLVAATAHSQQSRQKKEILTELNRRRPGKGEVTVYEDESIQGVLGRPMGPPRKVYTSEDGQEQYFKMRGFKIQAFSGNNQRTSKNEAYHKQQLINSSFPEYETVVLFDSPFWRLRVGNFEKREEATEVMEEISNRFPTFGKEMYIVVDEVKIPTNQTYSDGDERHNSRTDN